MGIYMNKSLQHSSITCVQTNYTWTYSHQGDSCCFVLGPIGVKVEAQLMRHSQMEVAVKSLVVLWRSGSAGSWSNYVLYSKGKVREGVAKPQSREHLGQVGLGEARAQNKLWISNCMLPLNLTLISMHCWILKIPTLIYSASSHVRCSLIMKLYLLPGYDLWQTPKILKKKRAHFTGIQSGFGFCSSCLHKFKIHFQLTLPSTVFFACDSHLRVVSLANCKAVTLTVCSAHLPTDLHVDHVVPECSFIWVKQVL